jgi:hypothetical protein
MVQIRNRCHGFGHFSICVVLLLALSRFKGGTIAAVVVSVLVVFAIVVGVAIFLVLRRRGAAAEGVVVSNSMSASFVRSFWKDCRIA